VKKIIILALCLSGTTAYGIDFQKGTLNPSACGINILESGWVNQVCLVHAVKIPGAQFLTLDYTDDTGDLFPIVSSEERIGRGGPVTRLTVYMGIDDDTAIGQFATVLISRDRHQKKTISSHTQTDDTGRLRPFQAQLQDIVLPASTDEHRD